jgi:hypothetical protein
MENANYPTPPREAQNIARFLEYEKIEITTQSDADNASDYLKAIQEHKKFLKKQRDTIIGPIQAGIKSYNAREKEILDPINRVGATIREKLIGWSREQEKMRQDAACRLRDASLKELEAQKARQIDLAMQTGSEIAAQAAKQIEANQQKLMERPVQIDRAIRTDRTTVAIQKRWKWKVTKSDEIPMEYYILDEKKINSEVREQKDKTQIPGVEVYQEEYTSVR